MKHSFVVEARALLLVVLLGVGVAAEAQFTDGTAEASGNAKADETWTSDLKAPLRPADDVGGSWNWLLAYGRMTDEQLTKVFALSYGFADANLLSGEIGYTLKDDNPVVRFLDPVLSSVDVAMNVTYQDDPAGDIFVFSPYIMARWSNFPWSNTIRTTFGAGIGLSYATDIPSIEFKEKEPNGDYNNLQNYIAIEATFALPQHKDWQLVYRLHHRSAIRNLYGDNAGNTAVQIGLRHYFK